MSGPTRRPRPRRPRPGRTLAPLAAAALLACGAACGPAGDGEAPPPATPAPGGTCAEVMLEFAHGGDPGLGPGAAHADEIRLALTKLLRRRRHEIRACYAALREGAGGSGFPANAIVDLRAAGRRVTAVGAVRREEGTDRHSHEDAAACVLRALADARFENDLPCREVHVRNVSFRFVAGD